MTLCFLNMHPHTKLKIPTSKNIGDMHWTGSRTDGLMYGQAGWAVRLLYASRSSFWGIENSFGKTIELLFVAILVCINSTSLNKAWIAVRWSVILVSKLILRCSLNFNPQSVIRYQQFALYVKMSNSGTAVEFTVGVDICNKICHQNDP